MELLDKLGIFGVDASGFYIVTKNSLVGIREILQRKGGMKYGGARP